jgi:hypothetical protein
MTANNVLRKVPGSDPWKLQCNLQDGSNISKIVLKKTDAMVRIER